MGEVGSTGSSTPRKTFGDIGERGFIARIRPLLPSRQDVVLGAGDDCAITAPPSQGEELVLKADPLVEGHHFLATDDPRRIGHKALARVLSDFASMGAEPRWALVDFAAPPQTPVAFADALLEGFSAVARKYGVALVGGDTSCGASFSLHVFCAGAVPRGEAMRRDCARSGDAVYATGLLGASYASGHHFDFEPRLAEGAWLRRRGVRAAIDISDGLSSEAWHLARASKVRIALDASTIPLSLAARRAPNPLAAALGDGEDFELLFTAPAADSSLTADFAAVFPDTPISRIGVVESEEAGGEVVIAAPGSPPKPLAETGYDHFA